MSVPHYAVSTSPRALRPDHPYDAQLLRVPACDRARVTLAVIAFLHSTPDAGRPSDAARTVVSEYLRDPAAFLARA